MVPALVLVAMIVVAATGRRTGRAGAVALALLSLLWLLTNSPMEGPVLVSFTADHGFTAGDLAGVAGLAVAVWRFRKSPPRR